MAECLRVIEYPKLAGKFRTDPRLLVERAMASAHMVPTDLLPAIDVVKADPSDNVYVATAVAGGARWLVTGNTRHLTPLDGYAGLRIVEPAVFQVSCSTYDVLVRDELQRDCVLGNLDLCLSDQLWVIDNFTLRNCGY